ncbi:NrdH-redoxin [Malaciobacter molluscorum LMG 25693]|uniref:Glutaredoxin, NrdH/YruB family n=1 Tax=Malaciobacter molluscorum LMG 25693 TaxID=870501 RepID=A0A2G1DIV5_9BACT|nr:glutaredoxin domain-containing protein [Malaciobacter molluscorum]AXX93166.1 glutaredoxin, NrdH/YruB family [Malaciobacter molluscorum LMG 25693]PHO18422.1 NrdH-redoxin [Malaciobacter molluscorum LMG 25693]RXJ95621.1 NrdH-redoxin [Malaciobacter molluscorum]
MKPIALFTIPNCKWCEKAKAYFKSKNIRYNQIDVSRNKQALKDCQKHGCNGAPVVLIGNCWICGFDKEKINKELGIK